MRILVTSTPGTGHLSAPLPLATALQSSGHNVLVVTGPESCQAVEQRGFAVRAAACLATHGVPPTHREWQRRWPCHRGVGAVVLRRFLRRDRRAPMRTDLMPVFDEFRPDVVVSERGELAAVSWQPVAASPRHGRIQRRPPAVVRATPHRRHRTAVDCGGSADPTMDQINGDLYLHPFPPSFDQAPTSGNVRPMRAVAANDGTAPPPWLDEIGTTRPLIYLTAGTEAAAAELFPWAEAVAVLGTFDVDVIATVGPRIDPAFLGVVSPNIRVERFVPQHFILGKAGVLVSHSGAGSILGAAAHGIPQLLFPVRADQWENADAASGAGVALTLELDQRSEDDIAAAVERMLTDDRFKIAAVQVADEISTMPTPTDHVATIEKLGNGGSSDG
jgi:UDP:flavonoid glycosyltransferase YjiC (YdhE family)